MALCRFLPTPSDRMGIMWSLLTVEDSIILEYGPAGTTHFSMGFFGRMNIQNDSKLFTTHMSEDDVVMGDVSRLEEALLELDDVYAPKVIFVLASSVSSVIGTDVKGVCSYMQEKCNAKLIAFEQGGFRGDYSIGLQETYSLITKTLVKESEKKPKTFNIIGASMESYRIVSDVNEIKRLMNESFSYNIGVSLCSENSLDSIEKMSSAEINLVLTYEGLKAAKYLEKTYGTPYVYGAPYGYKGTLEWLESVAEVINDKINPSFKGEILERIQETSSSYMMYQRMLKDKKAKAYIYADYDKANFLGNVLEEEFHIKVENRISKHSLKAIKDIQGGVVHIDKELDRINLLKSLDDTFVLADDVSISLVNDTNTTLRFVIPMLKGSQVATHLPFVGLRGADFIKEFVDLYYGRIM